MIFKPTTFFIIVQTSFGLELEIQLISVMQVYIKVDVTYKQKTNGKEICMLTVLSYNSYVAIKVAVLFPHLNYDGIS